MEEDGLQDMLHAQDTRSAILDKLTPIFREVFFDDELVLSPDLSAERVAAWDSVGHVRLLVEIERKFSVRFRTTEISGLKNVGQLADLIRKKVELAK